ncbi:MAG: Ig-like domain-containing protein [Lachnospiraceae bacterium]
MKKGRESFVIKSFMSVILLVALILTLAMPPVQAATRKRAEVLSVTIMKPSTSTLVLKKGKTYNLKTSVKVSGKITKSVVYGSSNRNVVGVTSSGKIIARRNGTAKVTVWSAGNWKKKAVITVKVGTPVTSVVFDKTKYTGYVGKTLQLKTSVSPKSSTIKSVSYTSSNPSVAKVDSKGKVTFLKNGTATITAKAKDGSDKKATCSITVKTLATKVSLNKTSYTGYVGKTLQLTATVSPKTVSTKTVSYTSSNSSVAKVDSKGKVTFLKNGTATITAKTTDGSKKTATCKITVKTLVTKIILDKSSLTGKVGDTVELKVTVLPNTASTKSVSYTSSDETIAKVDSEGKVILLKEGVVTIIVKAKDASNKMETCEITVQKASDTDDVIREYEGYTLKWNEEFQGTALNRDDWNVELHEPGWVNAELQEYVDSEENIVVEDGVLKIKPVKKTDSEGNAYYTSGRINTQNKHDFKYGRFEVRAKVPTGKGYLPAFWMMPTNENLYGQWPRCGEIDIMEVMGQDVTKAYGTIHFGNPHSESQGTNILTEGNYADEWHVFSCEWEPGSIKWYIDDKLFHEENDWYSTTVGQGTVSYPAPFDQPFYMILNLAVGGSWVGYPDETTDFENQAFVVDWVRAYQKDSYDENVTKPEKEVNFREPDANGNYVYNGDFAVAEDLTDDKDWAFLTAAGGEAEAIIENSELSITTINAGTQNHSVQLVQPQIPVQRGNIYELSFDAYAQSDRTMIVDVSAPDRSWSRYLADTTVDLTTEKKTYTYTYQMADSDKDDANGRIEFNLGNTDNTSKVYISNVSIKVKDQFTPDDSKKPLTDGNYIYNGSFQEGAGRMENWMIQDTDNHAQCSVTDLNDGRRFMVTTTDCASTADVTLKQIAIPLATNGKYVLSFEAQADKTGIITAHIAGNEQSFELSTEKKTYTFNFETGDIINEADFIMDLGINGTVYLDNIRIDEDSLIKNGSFNAGLSGYEVYAYNTSDVNYVVDSLNEDNAFDITIQNSNDADWKIQLKQNNVNLIKDEWYTLKIDAKSSIERKLMYAIQRDGSTHKDAAGNEDWTPYVQEKASLTGDYQTLTKTFQMKYDTDEQSILSISMGAIDGVQISDLHRICIDNISLSLATPEEIEAATPTIPSIDANTEMIKNGNFAEGEANWIPAITFPGEATATFEDGKAEYDITNVGTADWNVQLKQEGITLENGCTYKVKFTASSTEDRIIKWAFLNPTYAWYGGEDVSLQAGIERECEAFVTISNETTDQITLVFSMGIIDGVDTLPSTVSISNVSLMKVE